MPDTVKAGPLSFFNKHSAAKFQKIEGEHLESLKNFRKNKKLEFLSLTVPKKSERRDPLGFFNIRSVAKYLNKLKGGLFEDILKNPKKKSHSAEKDPKGDPLDTSGLVGFLDKVKN